MSTNGLTSRVTVRIVPAAYYLGSALFSLVPAIFWALSLPFYIIGDSSSDPGEARIGVTFSVGLSMLWLLVTGFLGIGVSLLTGKPAARHIGLAVLGTIVTLVVGYTALTLYGNATPQPPPIPPMD
ncbi:hypothetical protein L1277_000393 [Okibacterium sp. HSC-33S16]|uniref:hypothetical protein n=1 Tax=Okibacterium sp. HSC-33S16 TaxID=2910965 RepID=UPI00209CA515|nr:hypothetical protein [Okibacterium sp. HSC-33S16]MCP2030329.1 hypothetical protein [Okibacterium sp. HSC-33S16]